MTGEIGRKHFVIILENSLQEFSCITCCILPHTAGMDAHETDIFPQQE